MSEHFDRAMAADNAALELLQLWSMRSEAEAATDWIDRHVARALQGVDPLELMVALIRHGVSLAELATPDSFHVGQLLKEYATSVREGHRDAAAISDVVDLVDHELEGLTAKPNDDDHDDE